MKKYVIHDSEGQKTTIYAKNITHALSYVENSKTRDTRISAYINLKKGDWFMEEGELYDVYHLIKENYENVKWKALAEHYEVDTDNHKIVKREDEVINYYDCKWGHVRYKKFNSKQEAFDLLNRMVKQSYDIVTIDSINGNITEKNLEDSKMKDSKLNDVDRLKNDDWFIISDRDFRIYHIINSRYEKIEGAGYTLLTEVYTTNIDNTKIVKEGTDEINLYMYRYNRIPIHKLSSKQEAFNILSKYLRSETKDSINESKVKDEASSATTINALIEDEKSATEAYNVAIKNLEGKIDEKAMQVLINIRNDERRHIENLYSILNGNITEKNLEDSKMKDSKLYVGISKYNYTKEQAERDARKFGLQLKIVGKSNDPHIEYDAYLIGPRSNILKMLKANDMEDFEEDIEDSVKF